MTPDINVQPTSLQVCLINCLSPCRSVLELKKKIFAGYTGSKNQVRNRLKIQFVVLDFSRLIFQKSSTDQQGVYHRLIKYEIAFTFDSFQRCEGPHFLCNSGCQLNQQEYIFFCFLQRAAEANSKFVDTVQLQKQ